MGMIDSKTTRRKTGCTKLCSASANYLLTISVSDVLAPEDDLAVWAKLDDEDSGAQEAS